LCDKLWFVFQPNGPETVWATSPIHSTSGGSWQWSRWIRAQNLRENLTWGRLWLVRSSLCCSASRSALYLPARPLAGALDQTAVRVLRRNEGQKQPKSPGGPGVFHLDGSECAERAYVEEPQPDAQVPPRRTVALVFRLTACCRNAHRSRKARTFEVRGGYQHVRMYNPEPGTSSSSSLLSLQLLEGP